MRRPGGARAAGARGRPPAYLWTFEAMVDRIAAVPAGASRPLWSVMIPAYDCARVPSGDARQRSRAGSGRRSDADRGRGRLLERRPQGRGQTSSTPAGSSSTGSRRTSGRCATSTLASSVRAATSCTSSTGTTPSGTASTASWSTLRHVSADRRRLLSVHLDGCRGELGDDRRARARRSRDSRRLAGAHRPRSAAADPVHGRAQIRLRAARWLRPTPRRRGLGDVDADRGHFPVGTSPILSLSTGSTRPRHRVDSEQRRGCRRPSPRDRDQPRPACAGPSRRDHLPGPRDHRRHGDSTSRPDAGSRGSREELAPS